MRSSDAKWNVDFSFSPLAAFIVWPQDVAAWAQEFLCSFDWSDERLNAFINSLDGGSPGSPDTVDITSSIFENIVDEPEKEEVMIANVDSLLDDGTRQASAANVESRHDNCETQQAQCQSDLFSFPPFQVSTSIRIGLRTLETLFAKLKLTSMPLKHKLPLVRLGNLVFRS